MRTFNAGTSGLMHTKEKPSKIANVTFAILPSYQKKILKLNGHPEWLCNLLLLMKPSDALQNGSQKTHKTKTVKSRVGESQLGL